MKEKEFLDWMLDSGYNQSKILGFIQACKEIERHEGSIEDHYGADSGRALLRRFRYSALDQANGRKPAHAVPVEGDAVKQTDALKKALKFYLDFLTCSQQQALLRSGELAASSRKIYAKRKPRPLSLYDAKDENDSYYSQFRPHRSGTGEKDAK